MELFWGDDNRLRSGWRFVLSVILYFFLNSFALDLANSLAGSSDRKFELFYRPILMILLIGGFSILLKALDRVEGNPLPAMGLGRSHLLHDATLGVALGAAMIALIVVPAAIVEHASFRLTLSAHSLKLAAAVVLILATGAMAEEASFRGYPFQRLVDGLGSAGAIGLMAALFGVAHLRNPNASFFGVVNTIGIGVVLALAYLRTRSLWLPWGIHFGWNAMLGLMLGLPVSGIKEFGVIVHGTMNGPKWLTGGGYGIEGGSAGTLAILVGMGMMLVITKGRREDADPIAVEILANGSEQAGIQTKQGSGAAGAG